MRRAVVFVIALATLAAALVGVPATAMTNGSRLTPAPPWSALIIRNQAGLFEDPVCSGAVVGDGWILTANHCVYDGNTVLKPRNLRVLIGRDSRNAKRQGDAYGVAKIVPMPGFVLGVKNDAALIELNGFDSQRWHALPIAFENSVINGSGGVTLIGYGNYGWNTFGGETGAGLLWQSPKGAFVRSPADDGGMSCFRRTGKARVMHGDSGAPWLRWVSGEWQVIGVEDIILDPGQKGTHDPACGTGPFDRLPKPDGRTFLQWVRDTASIPVPSPGTIVRNPVNGNAWLVGSDHYRRSIPDGGNYACLVDHGHRKLNMAQINIDTIPDRIGTNAICTTALDNAMTEQLHLVDSEVPALRGLVAASPEGFTGDAGAITLYKDGVYAGTAVFIYSVTLGTMNLLDWSTTNRAACQDDGLWDVGGGAHSFGCTSTVEPTGVCPSSLTSAFDAAAPPGTVRADCTTYANGRWAVVDFAEGSGGGGWFWRNLSGTWESATGSGP